MTEKLRMTSPDLAQTNIEKIAELFPHVITESFDDEGNLKRAIDFDALRQELSDHVVDGPQERYRLDWPGKREAQFTANTPISKTLRPVREESVDFDTTQNLFIEGDNLEVLKLLQESYLGKVKLIYIDPPYNTGNDFVYNDKYGTTAVDFLANSGEINEEGSRLVANTEANGRYHSDWLSMMYPRLKLARNLLQDDGLVLISIDGNEVHNTRKICDEIFGSACYKNTIAVRRGVKSVQAQFENLGSLSQGHEYILLYSRTPQARLPKLYLKHVAGKPGKWDTFWRGTDRPTMRYELFGHRPEKGQWRWEEERTRRAVENYETYLSEPRGMTLDEYFLDHLTSTNVKLNFVRRNEEGVVQYYVPPSEGKLLSDNWMDLTLAGSETDDFDTEKSLGLLERVVSWVCGPEDIVLDFFAGSGTTGHAAMTVNQRDGGGRRYILVQIGDEPSKGNADSLAQITRDRLRASAKKIAAQDGGEGVSLDLGLRCFVADTSNLNEIARHPDALEQKELDVFADNIKPDRSAEDLLFQVMLDWGLELSLPISAETLEGKEVYSVDHDALIACFDDEISMDLVRAVARRQPLRAVFQDTAFVDDSARINTEQIFAELSPQTSVKVI